MPLKRIMRCRFLLFASACLIPLVVKELRAQESVETRAPANEEMMRRLGLPIVELRCGPFQYACLADTGSGRTFLYGAQDLLKLADPQWTLGGKEISLISGKVFVTTVHGVPVGAFGTPPQASTLWVLPEDSNSWRPPPGIAGGAGMPELRGSCFRLNIREFACELYDERRLENETTHVSRLGIDLFGRSEIAIALPPNDTRYLVQIDTGARNCLQLPRGLIDHLNRIGVLKRIGNDTIRSAGSRSVAQHVIQSVAIEGFSFVDVPVIESNFYSVGTGLLSHFDVVLDFPGNRLSLKPLANDWPKRVPPDASGLLLMYMDENDLKIDVVEDGSSAAKAGLKVEDRILVCDGKEPKDWSMLDLRERLSRGGTKLPLRIRRGEKEFDLILPLEWQFEYPPKWPPHDQQIEEFDKFLKEQREKEKAGSKL